MTELQDAIAKQNPWWGSEVLPEESSFGFERRIINPLGSLALKKVPRRTVVLYGQRRVGKTVVLKQFLGRVLEAKLIERRHVCFVDLQKLSPSSPSLTEILEAFKGLPAVGDGDKLVIFDEIQFAEDWPHHLKTLTDHEKDTTFVASGSVSVVLNPKHLETGHGRVRDLYAPPLMFFEYLDARGKWPDGLPREPDSLRRHRLGREQIEELNDNFLDYMNFGSFVELLGTGYSETDVEEVYADTIQRAAVREIPMHYELRKTRALELLYKYIARHDGQELSKEGMAKASGVQFPTVDTYMEYLKDSFLVRSVPRAGNELERLQRDFKHKYLLENTAHHTSLFGPLDPNEDRAGHIVEATVYTQTLPPLTDEIHFLSFKRGEKLYEIDMIHRYKFSDLITRITEVKWSDKQSTLKEAAKNLSHFSSVINNKKHLDGMYCTTRSTYPANLDESGKATFLPVAQYCLLLGMEVYSKGVYSRLWKPGHDKVNEVHASTRTDIQQTSTDDNGQLKLM